ncbi:MAG: amidohydrolase [Saprospiraceae bacterium]|nr:amidohydrolase [Saprospiraceae bacterium]
MKDNHIETLVEGDYPHLFDLFCQYNQNPELGMDTFETARQQAEELRAAGYEVTEGVAQTGVVAVLKNGEGKTILFRADMDALPVRDERGEAWASKIEGRGHQCGHSMHSAMLIGIARNMAKLRDKWQGTAVFVCQPGEEFQNGSQRMIDDGLYERFPKPDCCLAYHVSPTLPSGTVGVVKGRAMALVQMLDIKVKGVGGHGGFPVTAIDAIVLAASIIMRLQTIVSREINPFEPAVVSVCMIKGGENHNVLPPEVDLKLTVRAYSYEVYDKILAAIRRICDSEAAASGLPSTLFPTISQRPFFTKPLINDPNLVAKMEKTFKNVLGEANVRQEPPYTFGEDFASYGLNGQIPIALTWLGSVNPSLFDENGQPTTFLPPLHHPQFNPFPEKTIKTGVVAMTEVMVDLFTEI